VDFGVPGMIVRVFFHIDDSPVVGVLPRRLPCAHDALKPSVRVLR